MIDAPVKLDDGIRRKEFSTLRDRFVDLSNARLRRILETLPPVQRDVLELLPVLFHFNHPMLPGYVNSDTPAGIADYQPPRGALLLARKLARSLPSNNLAQRAYPIRGLYLMGSLGSIGQDNKSDLDLWLCHEEDLAEERVENLQSKVQGIEDWGHSLGLEVHVFIVNVDAFRRGGYNELSEESSGSTQHHLLLEEFYRTAVLLAGLPPMWWLVPADQEPSYDGYCRRLAEHGFINPSHWIDLGHLDQIPAHEFFSAAHWQLHKSIDSPYKALLKLMLFEAYSSEYPEVRWLSLNAKASIQGRDEPSADALDPYRLILQRITDYLTQRGEHDRLELARRAFYVKSGATLSRYRHTGWKNQAMSELVASWGWQQAEITLMDSRSHWKLDRVLSERNALVAELTRSYRMLTDFARQHADTSGLNARDLSLLGRKLHAALERRPGKVDRVNPGLSGDLAEEALWLRHEADDEDGRWMLFRSPPESSIASHVTRSLIELLAWAQVNGLIGPGTQVRMDPPRHSASTPEHLRLLKSLRKHLRPTDIRAGSLESFAHTPRLRLTLFFVNVMRDPLGTLSSAGLQRITDLSDPFNFGATKECLAHSVDVLQVTSWGEILVERFDEGIEGLLDALCQFLDRICGPDGCVAPQLQVQSFSSARGPAIAKRILELIHRLLDAFTEAQDAAQHIVLAGGRLYLIERGNEFRWLHIGDRLDLLEYLAEPLDGYRALSFDPGALPGSPLPSIYRHHVAGRIEAFYRIQAERIELWVLDENGALFEQQFNNASEHYFLTQQLRFFNSVLAERLVGTTQKPRRALADRVHFYRIEASGSEFLLQAVRPAEEDHSQYLDLQVLLGGQGAELRDFSVQAGSREFSSLALGERIYLDIARYLMEHRRRLDPYPFYITGIQPAELDDPGGLPVIRLLQIKRRLEQRLNEAQFAAIASRR